MSKSIEESIKGLILESLPAAQSLALKGELERLYQVEKDMAKALDDLDHQKTICSGYLTELVTLKALAEREIEINDHAKEVLLREQEAAAREAVLDLKEAHATERVNDHKTMVALVFKSPLYRKSVTSQKGVATPVDGGGGVGYVHTSVLSQDETTTIEEG